jgi:hypothetical protein
MSQNLDFNNLIPPNIQNPTLTGLMSNLFNRFVSQEESVQIQGNTGLPISGDIQIQESNLERQENSLIPGLTYSSGTEQYVYTFSDFIDKLNVLDADVTNIRSWMAEQNFNYTPPINYDKFINYSNYYWIGTVLPQNSGPTWNPTNLPEYYVIQQPQPNDANKMPVLLAETARNINLQINDRPTETFIITFTSPTTFEIKSTFDPLNSSPTYNTIGYSTGSGITWTPNPITISSTANEVFNITVYAQDSGTTAPAISHSPSYPNYELMTFVLTNGTTPFSTGDVITITTTYYTTSFTTVVLTSSSVSGKGIASGINTTVCPFMYIDGTQVAIGDRVLVTAQTNSTQNGIYTVSSGGQWQRTIDLSSDNNLASGVNVYVTSGTINGGSTFDLTSGTIETGLHFSKNTFNPPLAQNAWQLYNYWVHIDDLPNYKALGVTSNNVTQAQRPILEYNRFTQLNSWLTTSSIITGAGYPTDYFAPNTGNATAYIQTKKFFNQIPQFDLFRYDGTHANMTSGLFFYQESPQAEVDGVLMRRVALTVNGDYIFGLGMIDQEGRLLYYKNNNSNTNSSTLMSIWQPGVTSTTTSTPIFTGVGTGNISFSNLSPTADNQIWTLTFNSATNATLQGTRSGALTPFTIPGSISCDDFTLTVTNGGTLFASNDLFQFNVYNKLAPRYIESVDGNIINYPGGYAADQTTPNPSGAWLTPLRMFENLQRQTLPTIAFGDFLNHGRLVLSHQNGFIGSSFGVNNTRNLSFNPGFGGEIREFGSNFPLLSSMLIQTDISVLTMLTFAQQQYNSALGSIDQFLINNLAIYMANGGAIETQSINPNAPDIIALEAYFELIRSQNTNINQVFSDTTALVSNWPVTLPMIGLMSPTIPSITFDHELSQYMLLHHDGHVSPLSMYDQNFTVQLVQTIVTRSDGTKSAGVFAATAPSNPYSHQLWFNSITGNTYVFDVEYDTNTPPLSGEAGQFWYQRNTNTLYEWNTTTLAWVLAGSPSAQWIPFNAMTIRNSLVLNVENKLYASVHPAQQINVNLPSEVTSETEGQTYLALELATFAAEYGYDMFAPDYIPSNAFTWNYKQATISGVTSPCPARWFSIYENYFGHYAGSVATDRPDLEPWKLLGYTNVPSNWISTYGCTIQPTTNLTAASVIATSNITLSGLQIIDGISVTSGTIVLVSAQTTPQLNGLYIAHSGAWTRTNTLTNGLSVTISEGYKYANTTWVLTTANPITIPTTAIVFQQARIWNQAMWTYILSVQPSIKLCVNIYSDELLPPYVTSGLSYSSMALTNTIPTGINLGYSFGDLGPVELLWTKSLEYNYALARTAFRMYPLPFLDSAWGETYVTSGTNLRTERNLMTSLPSDKFLLHGERLNLINNYTPSQTKARVQVASGGTLSSTSSNILSFTVTHCGNNTTVFYAYLNGSLLQNLETEDYCIYEGELFNLVTPSGVIVTQCMIEDLGIAYEMGDTITITFTGSSTSYAFTPGQTKIFKGLGQLFTNLLRYSYIDTNVSLVSLAYRGWTPQLVHRLGALVRPDSMTITTSQGLLPDTAYSTILKRSVATESLWFSGLRIQLVQIGTSVLSPSGLLIPPTDGSDWIFRIEVYNPSYPQITYNTFDTSGDFLTFYALNKAHTSELWKQYQNVTGTATITMPLQVTGIQNVLNIVYGYTNYLTNQGFISSTSDTPVMDYSTGRLLNWQLCIEKYIDTVYAGQNAGTASIINPYLNTLYIQTPNGLTSRFTDSKFLDPVSSQACYDVNGNVIPYNNLNITRMDDQTIITSNTDIYSAHIFIDTYEHCIIFNDTFTSDPNSNVNYSPFLGEYPTSAYLTYTRQSDPNGKPTFDGYFISGNGLNRNISSSIDALQHIYDPVQLFNEPLTSPYSTALIGFQTKPYFDAMDISDQVQLDFWKGMISAKGTNYSIDAFTNYKAFSDSSIDEFWAYKLATYGDARERSYPEVKIGPSDCNRQYTSLQFYENGESNYNPLPLYIQVEADDSSRWFSLDDLGTNLRFDAQSISETVTIGTETFPYYHTLKNIYHTGDTQTPVITGTSGASMVGANILKVTQAGTYTVSGYTWIQGTQLSPIQLYDYVAETLDDTIQLWHPAIGFNSYEAMELINMQQSVDPANYNYTTQTTDNPNYMVMKPWSASEVGRVWWDTSNLEYTPYYDAFVYPNRETRQTRWGSLAEYASVDLYQWTASQYHPSLYNAQAALQEGNAAIDSSVALSGEVGFVNNYQSNREVTIQPIAWSMTSTSNGLSHPAFGSPTYVKIYNSNNNIIADSGRLADINIVSGYNLGGWNTLTSVPIGEVSIGTSVTYNIGSSLTGPSAPILIPQSISSGTITSITVIGIPNSSIFGNQIGQILFTNNNDGLNYNLRLIGQNGIYEDITLYTWTSNNLTANGQLVLNSTKFGIQIIITRSTTGTITASDLAIALTNVSNDVYIREAVNYTQLIQLPDVVFSNNILDAIEYGWKSWVIPTQVQLSADLPYPNNKWQPYIGVATSVSVTSDVVSAMQNTGNTYTLVNGITVNRYTSTWSSWVQLENTYQTVISNGSAIISFTLPVTSIDSNRLSVYANGLQLAPATLSVTSTTVTLSSVLPEGTKVVMLYRPYSPTAQDLAFNPTISDNFQNQIWYKQDYQYTQMITRSSAGMISGTMYYFWVKNKSIPYGDQNLSLQEAVTLLENGESMYMIFSQAIPDSNSASGVGYDSCAISGLGVQVTDINRYKLRFLRDFTLRSDPEQLNLKNVHTEWTLIRPHQTSSIPSQLWGVITNAVCGQDAGENPLPSQVRINYDATFGTETQYGFDAGQIFCPQSQAMESVINTVLNTALTIQIGSVSIIDYITVLNITSDTTADSLEAQYFSTPAQSRATMTLIYNNARADQINEIFFNMLNVALANNLQFTDLFKTSIITANSTTNVQAQSSSNLTDEFY